MSEGVGKGNGEDVDHRHSAQFLWGHFKDFSFYSENEDPFQQGFE